MQTSYNSIEYIIHPSPSIGVTDEDYSRTWSQVVSNGFRSEMIGQLLFLLFENISHLNHSCFPNAAVLEKDNLETAVLAIRDIQPGEEVCISYRSTNFLEWPCEKRRKWLRSNFFFHCCCERCSSEGELGMSLNVPSITSSCLDRMRSEWKCIKSTYEQLTELQKSGTRDVETQRKDVIERIEHFLEDYQTKLGNDIFHRWRLIAARSYLIDLLIVCEHFDKALPHLARQLVAEHKSYFNMRYHIARITCWSLFNKVKLEVKDKALLESADEKLKDIDSGDFESILCIIKSAYFVQ
jgi:hypothetical protein